MKRTSFEYRFFARLWLSLGYALHYGGRRVKRPHVIVAELIILSFVRAISWTARRVSRSILAYTSSLRWPWPLAICLTRALAPEGVSWPVEDGIVARSAGVGRRGRARVDRVMGCVVGNQRWEGVLNCCMAKAIIVGVLVNCLNT